jgi:hypothetical protein
MPLNLATAGLSALTEDTAVAAAGSALTAGTLYLNRVDFEVGGSLLPPSIFAAVGAAGVGASTGSFMGVYNCATLNTPELGALSPVAAGTRVAQTADLGAAIAAGWGPTAGGVPLVWATGFGELPTGQYWLAILVNQATTQPVIAQGTGGGTAALANLSAAAANKRYATNGTGLTTLPATITVASNADTNARPLCMGLAA